MNLYDLIIRSADAALDLQKADGSMPPGHNGPYHDPETPVRNTSHWLITFLKVYEISGEQKYRIAAERAVHYLLSDKIRPHNATFWCLKSPKNHPSNGLIGQAWVIEALVYAANLLDIQECYSLAESLFLLHPWDENKKAWRKVHINGTIDEFDYTFNHQLWFAAASGLLKNTPEALERAKLFINNLKKHMIIYRNGVIKHINPFFIGRPIDIVKLPIKVIYFYGLYRKYYYLKAVGYHAFNLYALSILKNSFNSFRLPEPISFERLFSPIQNDTFIRELDQSKYAYPYNPAGIEIAYSLQTFYPERSAQIKEWLHRQFLRTWNDKIHMMSKNAADPTTNAARIYQAARLRDYAIEIR